MTFWDNPRIYRLQNNKEFLRSLQIWLLQNIDIYIRLCKQNVFYFRIKTTYLQSQNITFNIRMNFLQTIKHLLIYFHAQNQILM